MCYTSIINVTDHFCVLSPQRSASVVAANSPMMSATDQSADDSNIKSNKFSRKSIGSPMKQSTEGKSGHVPNGKNSNKAISIIIN